MTTRPTGRQRGRPPYPLLTPAEERVLQFIRKGHTNGEIAEHLGVSLDAVKYHVSNMLGKLELHSREELAGWRPQRNPLARLWGAIPLAAKLGAGGAAAAVVAGGAVLSALSPAATAPLYEGVVTVGYDGQPANGSSEMLQMSADGRYIVFSSVATNLAPDDTHPGSDIYRFDRKTGELELVSRHAGDRPSPASGPTVSNDGRYVAYSIAGSGGTPDGVVMDMNARKVVFALPKVDEVSISGDGRYVAAVRNEEQGQETLTVFSLPSREIVWHAEIGAPQIPIRGARAQFTADGDWLGFSASGVEGVDCPRGTDLGQPLQVQRRPFVRNMSTGEIECLPLGSEPETAAEVTSLRLSQAAVVFGLTRWQPASTGAFADSEVVVYRLGTGEMTTYSQPRDPFWGALDAPAIGAGGSALAVVNYPSAETPGKGWSISWTAPGFPETTVREVPSRLEDFGFLYSEPLLSDNGLSLAFAVRGQDRLSGSQVQDIYVVSR